MDLVGHTTGQYWRPRRMRCFFMHIPKTAGMTLRSILCGQYRSETVLPASGWEGLASVPRPLSAYFLYAGHFRHAFRRLITDDAFAFTFLRDPAERTLSHLRHLVRDPVFGELHAAARGRDLRALLEDDRMLADVANVQVRYLASSGATMRKSELVRAGENDVLATEDIGSALANLRSFAFIGFADDFHADVARLLYKLGLHPQTDMPRINVAPQDEGNTGELLEMARAVNAADYALYAAVQAERRRPGAPGLIEHLGRLTARGIYPTIKGPMTIDLDGPVPASGLWPGEAGDRPYRWSGPGCVVTMDLPLAARHGCTLEADLYMPEDVGDLSATIDGAAIVLDVARHDERSATVRIRVPPDHAQGMTRIELACSRTHLASLDDPREVGFVLSRLELV